MTHTIGLAKWKLKRRLGFKRGMKALFTFILLTFLLFDIYGQSKKKEYSCLDIDTIYKKGDSTLTKIFTYNNNILSEERTAFLFPDSLFFPRFKIKGNIFKKKIYLDRILKHGQSIEYSKEGNKKITEFYYDNLISTLYFNNKNKSITEVEYSQNKGNMICTLTNGEYIITGKKKK